MSEYIDGLENIDIISTDSNIESLNMVLNYPDNNAAIVPFGSFDLRNFSEVVENINNYENNQTRFLVLSKKRKEINRSIRSDWKTSLVILDDNDRPGLFPHNGHRRLKNLRFKDQSANHSIFTFSPHHGLSGHS